MWEEFLMVVVLGALLLFNLILLLGTRLGEYIPRLLASSALVIFLVLCSSIIGLFR